MKTLIICKSIHHQNTKKIAQVFAKILKAEIADPDTFDPKNLDKFDLVGFGSGIYMWKHHQTLFSFAKKLPQQKNKKAFIFSTSGVGQMGINQNHKTLKKILKSKKFAIVGEFTCPGWDTFGPFKLIGGLNRGRPNSEDLKKAQVFAKKLNKKT